ncbi:cation diffusion facilitator family transporter [Brevibacillus migulae]|uniref:cation diffusion facilitator family transporter n=1 Tax=Brevibacillus migulae TaxID=1644114 RepID=UPI00106EA64B|nr:cation diffusion facilitator family transporter [Brevibacillus migulae]
MQGEQSDTRYQMGRKGVYLSIFAYLLLSATKIGFGLATGAKALVADGWNNVSDVLASLVILLGMWIAQKPADHDHRYGHVRAETMASLIAAFLMAVVGVDVLKQAIGAFLRGPILSAPDPLAMYIAVASAVVMYLVYRYNVRIAKQTQNAAMMAAAYDNRSDAWVSLGAALGIGAAQLGWYWADPVLAVIIGGLILRTAWEVGYEAIHSLMDGFDAKRLAEIEEQIEQIDGIHEVKDIRARYQGSAVHVDVTIGVDHHLTVVESHELTERVESRLIGKEGIERVYIHVEPAKRKMAKV